MRSSLRHQSILCDDCALKTLRRVLGDFRVEVYGLSTPEGHRYVRIMTSDSEATFGLRSGRRIKNSRGLSRYDRVLKDWLSAHYLVLEALFNRNSALPESGSG